MIAVLSHAVDHVQCAKWQEKSTFMESNHPKYKKNKLLKSYCLSIPVQFVNSN